jgi:hypothetical protein
MKKKEMQSYLFSRFLLLFLWFHIASLLLRKRYIYQSAKEKKMMYELSFFKNFFSLILTILLGDLFYLKSYHFKDLLQQVKLFIPEYNRFVEKK